MTSSARAVGGAIAAASTSTTAAECRPICFALMRFLSGLVRPSRVPVATVGHEHGRRKGRNTRGTKLHCTRPRNSTEPSYTGSVSPQWGEHGGTALTKGARGKNDRAKNMQGRHGPAMRKMRDRDEGS